MSWVWVLALVSAPVNELVAEADKGVEIRAESPFREIPAEGFYPLHLQITNRTGKRLRYELSSRGSRQSARRHFENQIWVDPGQSVHRELLLPVVPSAWSYWGQHELFLDGWATQARVYRSSRSGGSDPQPVFGASPWFDDALEACKPLDHNGRREDYPGDMGLSLDALPSHPLGLVGLDALLLRATEFESLSPDHKKAVESFVLQGGRLILEGASVEHPWLQEAALARTDVAAVAGAYFGFGSVVSTSSKAGHLSCDNLSGLLGKPRLLTVGGDAFVQRVAQPQMNRGMMFGFLFAFGVLVGPVNVYLCARRNRRVWLLWTTPVASISVAVLMVAAIVLQDGFGGAGERRQLRYLYQGAEVIYQAQVSRSGALLRGQFELAADIRTEWLMTADSQQQGDRTLEQTGQIYHGDWFQSRERQALVLQQIQPTRARVRADWRQEPPLLISEHPATLAPLWVVGPDQRVWYVERLGPGERQAASAVAPAELADWRTSVAALFPLALAGLWSAPPRAGHGYARTLELPMIETLGEIRWSSNETFLLILLEDQQ